MSLYKRGAQRQRICLSQYAINIIETDMIAFMDSPNISGFINSVLRNIWQTSDASISLAKKREHAHLTDTLHREQYLREVPNDPEFKSIPVPGTSVVKLSWLQILDLFL